MHEKDKRSMGKRRFTLFLVSLCACAVAASLGRAASRPNIVPIMADDPLRFELENEVTVLDAHAPEIFQDEVGDWFISSVEWPYRGVSLARLVWE